MTLRWIWKTLRLWVQHWPVPEVSMNVSSRTAVLADSSTVRLRPSTHSTIQQVSSWIICPGLLQQVTFWGCSEQMTLRLWFICLMSANTISTSLSLITSRTTRTAIIRRDTISTAGTQAVRPFAVMSRRRMTTALSTAQNGPALIRPIPTSILIPHSGNRFFPIQRLMPDGHVAA